MSVRPGVAVRALATIVLLAALAACGGRSVDEAVGPGTRPGTGGSGGGGGPSTDSATVTGRWSRLIYVYDDFGYLNASETVWTFSADGAAARTVYTTNLALGISDATVSLARWQLVSGEMVITYQPPDAGTVRFPYRIETSLSGRTLYLGNLAFLRIGA